MKVIVVGGGWAGSGAAIAAKNAGAEVTVLERTDMLLGTGLVGGIMRNNGRFTATEEAIALGANEIFETIDANCRHTNIEFPGHSHASLYDIALIEPAIKALLKKKGIEVRTLARVKDVEMDGDKMVSVILTNDEKISGDVFIDATGSAGPMVNCGKYGNGGNRRNGERSNYSSQPAAPAQPKEEQPKDMYNHEYSINFKRTGGGKLRSFGEKKRTF